MFSKIFLKTLIISNLIFIEMGKVFQNIFYYFGSAGFCVRKNAVRHSRSVKIGFLHRLQAVGLQPNYYM